MPEIASPAKIAKIKAYGAEAVIGGAAYAEAQERCDAYVAESGALLIHPYDAVETVAGQGTVALEWEEDLERLGLEKLDTVLIAVGGGGLIAGVAAWFRGRVKVVGVEPEGSRALHAALEADKPVDVTVNSIAGRFARREADWRTRFRDRQELRERRRSGQRRSHHRGAAQTLGGSFDRRRTGRGGGLRRHHERRLSTEHNERVGVLVCGSNADLKTFCLGRTVETQSLSAKSGSEPLRCWNPNYCPPAFRQPAGVAARWGVAKW